MKQLIIFTLSSLLFLSCNKTENFDIDKYILLEYNSYKKDDKTVNYVTYNFAKINDSIGKLINQRKIRIGFLLANRIKFSALSKLYPDSTSIEKKFKQKLNSDSVKPYVQQLIFPKKYLKKKFTEEQIMLVASRFILVQKRGNRGFGATVCYTINGQKEINLDDILLKSTILDAIRYNMGNKKITPNITTITNGYILKSYKEHQKIKSLDSLEPIIKNDVFDAMFSDSDYKKMVLNYLKDNKDNLPFTVIYN